MLTPLAAAVLEVREPERALCLECGEGDAALFLAREFPRARVRGVDRSEQAVRAAGRRVGLDPEGRVAFKAGSPRSLPYPDAHFDLVVAVDILPSLREVARVLRGAGYLVLVRTQGSGAGAGRLLAWRLSRRRFSRLAAASAGDGSFSVWRVPAAKPGSLAV